MKTVFLVSSIAFIAISLSADPFGPKTIRIDDYVVKVQRLPQNPIISYASSDTLGTKINGPSLIRVPSWIENPLGKYYLYFAHHNGKHIRLAYANQIEGPWTVYEPGTLKLEEAHAFQEHIASPDAHVDEASQKIRMYFHGSRANENQKTALAISKDGLNFKASNRILGSAYFRVFKYKGYNYAIDAHGFLNRSRYHDRGWAIAQEPIIAPITVDDLYGRRDDVRIRHSATWVKDDTLFLFYSRKADAPERILLSVVPLSSDWSQWKASKPVEILRPETDFEGIQYPITPSKKGGAIKVQQLRDPAIFHDRDGKSYLLYSVAGEMGLAIANISITPKPL